MVPPTVRTISVPKAHYTFENVSGFMDDGRLRGHTVPVNVISFSVDGKHIASADESGLLMV